MHFIFRPGIALCKVCPESTYNVNMMATECLPCPAGYRCEATNIDPIICVKGSASAEGETLCTSKL